MVPFSPCPDKSQLEEGISGRLPPRLAEELARHLEQCSRCAELVQILPTNDSLADSVVDAVRLQAAPEPDDPQVCALIDRLSDLPGPASGRDATALDDAASPATNSVSETLWDADDLLNPPREPGELGAFGPYRIVRRLGSGGMGVVYLARQDRPHRLVALKVVSAGEQRRARFLGETEIIARLQHPNIVPVLEVGEHDGQPYYTMEFVEGGSLATQLAMAPLVPRAAAALVERLGRAISFAHEHGIVHRDLKPANILLQRKSETQNPKSEKEISGNVSDFEFRFSDFQPKIADFGLARDLEAGAGQTETGAILGTPGYMAPEQASGSKAVGPPADVYALGAILYECLTGRPPFRAASVLETLEQVRRQEPVAPSRLQPGLPRDLQTITLKCLEKEPAHRYASATALADDLGRFLRGEPIRARAVGLVERLGKWVRRKPALAALVAISAASLAAFVVGAFIHNSRLNVALLQAKTSAEDARAQRERAETNYRQARDTINRMLAQLNNDGGPPKVPGVKLLEQKQREAALTFFQEVVRQIDNPDPSVQLDVATAYMRAAGLQGDLGRQGLGEENFQRAREILEALVVRYPKETSFQAKLAECYMLLGNTAGIRNDARATLDYRFKVVDLCETICRELPESEEWQSNLVVACNNLGVTYLDMNDCAEAERWLQKAQGINRLLSDKHHDDPVRQARVAVGYLNLGDVYRAAARAREAETSYQSADAILQPIVRNHPKRPEFGIALAALDESWSHLLIDQQKHSRAAELLTRSVRALEELVRQDPQGRAAKSVLLPTYLTRVRLYMRLGSDSEALADWKRIFRLTQTMATEEAGFENALAQANLGDCSQALAHALPREDSPNSYFRSALVYAACAKVVARDAKIQPDPREAEYADRALALLRQAQAAGYFKSRGRVTDLRQDPILAPLHTRPAFQELLRELQ
jgi:serine/threonine protein kinase